MHCNPDVCPHCEYIGEGDSYCDETQEIVLADWSPTTHYMGAGCPYARNKKKESRESRAVRIAARVMAAAEMCIHDSRAKCRKADQDCVSCIRSWLLNKARFELNRERG